MGLHLKRLVIVLFTCACLISCASSKLSRSWTDPQYRGSQYDNLLIIGATEDDNIRRTFEKQFAEKLEAAGIKAVESSSVMSKDQKIDKESILAVVARTGVDGVLLTYLVAVKEKDAASPSVNYTPTDDYRGGTTPDLSSLPGYGSPGAQYSATRVKVRLETNLYDAKTEQKVWSARSITLNPKSDTALIDSVIEVFTKDLKKNKLIP
jgi:hypothetical protein